MVQRDERLYFAEILSAIDRALEYTTEGREAFFADPKTQDAVVRNMPGLRQRIAALLPQD